jgi:hypothetical protein
VIAAAVAATAVLLLARAARRASALEDELRRTRRDLAAVSDAHEMLSRVRLAWRP